ncbi:hypothetical protein KIPB_001651 [Kipferlia bialata]|uniref:FYVE-type domain-containing protein n=1 Tax=Kipferlia bialata TaxID=797122 RepID=A0A9K3CQW0_9EUKA|nr:hypothetical protein KIPB_001651 [Kipferlia bialata]|eukprot:g1651.t1
MQDERETQLHLGVDSVTAVLPDSSGLFMRARCQMAGERYFPSPLCPSLPLSVPSSSAHALHLAGHRTHTAPLSAAAAFEGLTKADTRRDQQAIPLHWMTGPNRTLVLPLEVLPDTHEGNAQLERGVRCLDAPFGEMATAVQRQIAGDILLSDILPGVIALPYSAVTGVIRRRSSGHRPTGIEVFAEGGTSLLLTFLDSCNSVRTRLRHARHEALTLEAERRISHPTPGLSPFDVSPLPPDVSAPALREDALQFFGTQLARVGSEAALLSAGDIDYIADRGGEAAERLYREREREVEGDTGVRERERDELVKAAHEQNVLNPFSAKANLGSSVCLQTLGLGSDPHSLLSVLESLPPLSVRDGSPSVLGSVSIRLYNAWTVGALSTFDYLSMLNHLANRTCNDLTRYPVFPWVLKDYQAPDILTRLRQATEAVALRDVTIPPLVPGATATATQPRQLARTLKLGQVMPDIHRLLGMPMGGQDEKRAKRFKQRYESGLDNDDMPPFHYGTHYSSSGAVLHFLTRIEPFARELVRLQSGRFDHPDRLFYGVGEAWRQASAENMSDVKELTPEFYYTSQHLVNRNGFVFGRRHDNEAVDDVKLPPYCKGSPRELTRVMRLALESPSASQHMGRWVDIVFGGRQTGDLAVEALNVFYWLTYEKSVDVEAIPDPVTKTSTIDQITCFGTTPKCLYNTPLATGRVNMFDPLLENSLCVAYKYYLYTHALTLSTATSQGHAPSHSPIGCLSMYTDISAHRTMLTHALNGNAQGYQESVNALHKAPVSVYAVPGLPKKTHRDTGAGSGAGVSAFSVCGRVGVRSIGTGVCLGVVNPVCIDIDSDRQTERTVDPELAYAPSLVLYSLHTAPISALALCKGGRLLLTAASDGTLSARRLYDPSAVTIAARAKAGVRSTAVSKTKAKGARGDPAAALASARLGGSVSSTSAQGHDTAAVGYKAGRQVLERHTGFRRDRGGEGAEGWVDGVAPPLSLSNLSGVYASHPLPIGHSHPLADADGRVVYITCLHVSERHGVFVTGASDGSVCVYSLRSMQVIKAYPPVRTVSRRSAVVGLKCIGNECNIYVAGEGFLCAYGLSGDVLVRHELVEAAAMDRVTSFEVAGLSWWESQVLITGHADGSILLWNIDYKAPPQAILTVPMSLSASSRHKYQRPRATSNIVLPESDRPLSSLSLASSGVNTAPPSPSLSSVTDMSVTPRHDRGMQMSMSRADLFQSPHASNFRRSRLAESRHRGSVVSGDSMDDDEEREREEEERERERDEMETDGSGHTSPVSGTAPSLPTHPSSSSFASLSLGRVKASPLVGPRRLKLVHQLKISSAHTAQSQAPRLFGLSSRSGLSAVTCVHVSEHNPHLLLAGSEAGAVAGFSIKIRQGPETWEDSTEDACTRCRQPLSSLGLTLKRRHHCRICDQLVCAGCSKHTLPCPARNFLERQRVCYECYAQQSPAWLLGNTGHSAQ